MMNGIVEWTGMIDEEGKEERGIMSSRMRT